MTRIAAIIGTAGRKKDISKLTPQTYDRMKNITRTILTRENIQHCVSGGAAWADHVLISLCLEGIIPPQNITLHLPAELHNAQYASTGFKSAGGIANYYHRLMSNKIGHNTLAEIAEVIRLGARTDVSTEGFKARNTLVANDATHSGGILIAMTFGVSKPWTAQKFVPDTSAHDAKLNPEGNGTIDTWNKARCTKYHACLA